MSRWYPLQPVDESFFAAAPQIHRFPVDLEVPPERVWESLVSDRSVADWGLGVQSLTWTTPRPFGVGTRRSVSLPLKAITVHEHFFVWEEGRRYAFYAYEANRPLFQHFAEDYLIEPTPTGSRFTWTIAVQGTAKTGALVRAAAPLNRLLFGQMAAGAKRYFAKQASAAAG